MKASSYVNRDTRTENLRTWLPKSEIANLLIYQSDTESFQVTFRIARSFILKARDQGEQI